MILLFTDFGYQGPYVGEMKAALATQAPGTAVIDLMHDAPAHSPAAAAYLLAALATRFPPGTICVAVVDPGVGSDRDGVVLECDGRRFVGPDNGLFEPLRRRAAAVREWRIDWRPERLSASFHGRDLFAPVAAMLAAGDPPPGAPLDPLRPDRQGADWPEDLAEIVYIDRFGNAMTGLRATGLDPAFRLRVSGRTLPYARTFSEVPEGAVFWYENSAGLVEVACNRADAAARLDLHAGDPVALDRAE